MTDTCEAFFARFEDDFDIDFTDAADLVTDAADLDTDVADFVTDVADFVTDVADFVTDATDFDIVSDDFDKTGSSDGVGCSSEVLERFEIFDFETDNFDEVDFIEVTDFASGFEVKDRFVTDVTDGIAVAEVVRETTGEAFADVADFFDDTDRAEDVLDVFDLADMVEVFDVTDFVDLADVVDFKDVVDFDDCTFD